MRMAWSVVCAVGLVALLSVVGYIQTSGKADSTSAGYWRTGSDVQIRLYADRGVRLPDGGWGGAVQLYGVKLSGEGSEKTVWKHFLWEFSGLMFDHTYHIRAGSWNTIHLYLPGRLYLEIDRASGIVVNRSEPGARWYSRPTDWLLRTIVDRPPLD